MIAVEGPADAERPAILRDEIRHHFQPCEALQNNPVAADKVQAAEQDENSLDETLQGARESGAQGHLRVRPSWVFRKWIVSLRDVCALGGGRGRLWLPVTAGSRGARTGRVGVPRHGCAGFTAGAFHSKG